MNSDRAERPGRGPADLSRIVSWMAGAGGPDSHFAINTSTRCQHRCVYCFEGERGGLRDVPADDVFALLRQASQSVRAVVFMGAEATLRRDFVDLVAYGTGLGLEMRVSTNGLRFADRRFLAACLDAGLKAVELSFPYPDEATYLAITGAKPTGFRMLLQAMDNLRAEGRAYCNVNVVVSAFNHTRLGDAIQHAADHLGDALSLVTIKRCSTNTPKLGVAGDDLLDALITLYKGWPHPFPAIHRSFPMCLVPGYEHLDADLVYIRDRVPVLENFRDQDRFVHMYDHMIDASVRMQPECEACTLNAVCFRRELFDERPDEARTRPRTSRRDPRQVLVANGAAPERVDDILAALRTSPGTTWNATPDQRLALAARMGLCRQTADVAGFQPDPDGHGFYVVLASPDGRAQARLRLDRLDEPVRGTLTDLSIDDGMVLEAARAFLDAVVEWSLPVEAVPDAQKLATYLADVEAGGPPGATRTLAVVGDRVVGWRPSDGTALVIQVFLIGGQRLEDALFCGRHLLGGDAHPGVSGDRLWLSRVADAMDADVGSDDADWLGALWRAFGPRLWPGTKQGAVLRSVLVPLDGTGAPSVIATFDLDPDTSVTITIWGGASDAPAFVRTARVAMSYNIDGPNPADPKARALLDAFARRLPR